MKHLDRFTPKPTKNSPARSKLLSDTLKEKHFINRLRLIVVGTVFFCINILNKYSQIRLYGGPCSLADKL